MNRALLFLGLACASLFATPPARAQTPETVRAAEYFFDTDPGPGQGTALAVPAPDDTVDVTASITVPATLTPGEHVLYIRTLADTPGGAARWSLARGAAFSIRRQVIAAEYFFDTDPGPGAATPWPTAVTTDDSVDFSAAIPTTGLAPGSHTLYVRTRSSAGAWGLARAVSFFIQPAVVAGEYFFDVDPGAGQGTPLPSFSPDDSVDQNLSVAVSAGLARGPHVLYIRTRSSTGAWSLTRGQAFFVKPRIAAAEYFWDTDPGVGAGTALAVSTLSDSVDVSYTLTAPCLSPGQHLLYLRTRDETGAWSLARADTLTFSNPAVTATAAYPGSGPFGTPLKVTGSGGQAPYTYRVDGGTFAADSIFLVSNGASILTEVQDACGYTATAAATTPAAPTQLASGSRGGDTVVSAGWRHWFYALDSAGHIVGAVRDGGQSLGEVRFTFGKNPGSGVRQFGPGSNGNRHYLDRNWLVTTEAAPTAPVGVALFATNTEFAALDAADPDPDFDAVSDLYITKYDGANEDLEWNNNLGSGILLSPDSSTAFAGGSAPGYGLWFSVASFSEFYQSGNYNVPLDGRVLLLDAQPGAGGVDVRWQCDDEARVVRYTLQRQLPGRGWTDLTTNTAGLGAYHHHDADATPGVRYYRVRLTEASGSVQTSRTVTVSLKPTAATVTLSPNPTRTMLRVRGVQPRSWLSIVDAAGRTVQRVEAASGEAVLDVRALPAGAYWLRVLNAAGVESAIPFSRAAD